MIQPTINLGDLIVSIVMTVFSAVLIPLVWVVWGTVVSLRDNIAELRLIILGPAKDQTTGVLMDIAMLKKESVKHRNWLIRLSAETGSRIEDRT